MKPVFKRILQALFGISLLLLISGVVITFFFSEKVEKNVVNEIQEQITSALQFEDVSFSLYEKLMSKN